MNEYEIQIGSFFIDTEENTMYKRDGNKRMLSKAQCAILSHMYYHNKTTREELIRAAWKYNDEEFESALDTQIARINTFFFDGSAYIDNIYDNIVTLVEK